MKAPKRKECSAPADRPSYAAEYRTEAADSVIASEKSIAQVAAGLGMVVSR